MIGGCSGGGCGGDGGGGGDGRGKKKKKAYIRTVKRNFLTNNINHMLCNS